MSSEMVKISPETFEVMTAYLENGQCSKKTASALNMSLDVVQHLLERPEAKRYIDRLYYEGGFRNRNRMAELMDEILNQKLAELEDTGVGSSLDVMEIVEKIHKMKMAEIAMSIKLIEAENKGPSVQVNTQINTNVSGGERYNALLERLINGDKK